MPKRKKRTTKKQKDEDISCDAKKVAAASSTSQCGDDGDEIPSFTSVPLLRAPDEGGKGSLTSHFMCNYCEFSAESKADLISHMRKHMIKCTKCQFSSLSRKEVTQHCRDEHDVDFEEKVHEVATSSTEVEMDKDPCSACVFCKFMTYSTEHLERHTTLKHPGMLPKSVAKMVTKLTSTQIRQGDVRFYLAISGKDSTEDSKLVTSSPPKEVSSEPIEIEDENYIDVKPKFEPVEQKVPPEIVDKHKPPDNVSKSFPDTKMLETFTQQLAKRMKMENTSVRSEADTSESETRPEKGVKVETIYCLTCPYSNVLIDKLKCHTLVQHPLGAAVATYSATPESSMADFTFFCVKEDCPYSTGDLKEFQKHIMLCCSEIKSLKVIERERLKSTVTFIFEIQKKHSLNMEKDFSEFASPVMPQIQEKPPRRESIPVDNPSQLPPLNSTHSNIVPTSESHNPSQIHENIPSNPHPFVHNSGMPVNPQPSKEANFSPQQALPEATQRYTVPSNEPHGHSRAAPAAYDHLPHNQVPQDLNAIKTQGAYSDTFSAVQRNNDSNQFTAGHQTLQHPVNNFANPQHQIARGRKRNIQGQPPHFQNSMPSNHMQVQQQFPLQGLTRPRAPLPSSFRGQAMYRGRGRPSGMVKPGACNAGDDDVIVTAVVRMPPSNQRGRPPPPARGRNPAMSPQRLRGPVPNHNQMSRRPRGRGAPVRPNFSPIPQPRPFDMSSHFEALACAADPNEEDELQIVGMTPGKDGAMGTSKAVDASRFSYCCLHCGKDQGSKKIMKQHMKACHNDTLLGAFTNIDTGQWLYFCPQLHCAFMTYNEQRLSDHLEKCCDPEKLKAFDFGVAMNNLKSMKIRQMEVKSVSGSQNDPIDLDGRGMRDRFSTSLNDAFDDIVVNTTGRQMVRPPVKRPPQALPIQQSQTQRMPVSYQPVGLRGRGRGALHSPQQPMGGSPRGFHGGRPLAARHPPMHQRFSSVPRPVGRSPGFLPSQAAARGPHMAHMQRPRMPHPQTRQRLQPTTDQNPIVIDIDPDSPERPKDIPPDGFGNVGPGVTRQSQFSSFNRAESNYGNVNGVQSQLMLQDKIQNQDQNSSNFLSIPDHQLSGSDNFTPSQQFAFVNLAHSKSSPLGTKGNSGVKSSAAILEHQANPINNVSKNLSYDPIQTGLDNPHLITTLIRPEKTQESFNSNASSIIQENSINYGAGVGGLTNSEYLTHSGYSNNYQTSTSSYTSTNEQGVLNADIVESDIFEKLEAASRLLTDDVSNSLQESCASSDTIPDSQVTQFRGENFEFLKDKQPSLIGSNFIPTSDLQHTSKMSVVATDTNIAVLNMQAIPSTEGQPFTSTEIQPTSALPHMSDACSSEQQIDAQCRPVAMVESESFADTSSASQKELPSAFSKGMQPSLAPGTQYVPSLENQTISSNEQLSESLFDKQPVNPSMAKQHFPLNDGQSLFSEEPQPMPPVDVQSGMPSNHMQSEAPTSGQPNQSTAQTGSSIEKQATIETDLCSSPSQEMLSAPLTDMQYTLSSDMQSAPSSDMQSTLSSDMQSAPSSDMQSAPSSDMQSTLSSDMQSTLSSDMQSTPSTDIQSAGSTDMQSTPSTDIQSAGSSDIQSAPSTDIQSEGADMQSAPSSDMQSAPSTDMQSTPSTDMQSAGADMHSTPSTDIQSTRANMQSTPSTDMQSSSSELQSAQLNDMQSALSTDMQSLPSTDMQSAPSTIMQSSTSTYMQSSPTDMQYVPSTDMQSPPSTDIQSILSTDKQYVPSTDMQYSPNYMQNKPSTDMQSAPSTDMQSVLSTDMQSAPSTDMESAPSTDMQSAPSTDMQSAPSTDMQSAPSTDIQIVPSTDIQSAPKTDVQSAPKSDMQSVPPTAMQLIPLPGTHSVPSIVTLANPVCDKQPAPYNNNKQFTATVEPQSLPSTCTQHVPSRNLNTEHHENNKVFPVNSQITSANAQPLGTTSGDAKAIASQNNHWSSEIFDEEERINAVVLEKVFAKVPDMPKTLSRRLVFKFKQYANYKNVKITPDSKVIDEFVSKISYKRSGSADQKNIKPTQGAVNNASSSMSTRSGRPFSEPSSEVKTTALSNKDSSLKKTESESTKVKEVRCASMDSSNISQVKEDGVHKAHEAGSKEFPVDKSVKVQGTCNQHQSSLTSGNTDCNSEPQTAPRENTSMAPPIKESKTFQKETNLNVHNSDFSAAGKQKDSLSDLTSPKERVNLLSSAPAEETITSGNILPVQVIPECYDSLQSGNPYSTDISKCVSEENLVGNEGPSEVSRSAVRSSFESFLSGKGNPTDSTASVQIDELKDTSQGNSLEPNLKPCQADANNTLKEYQSTLEKNVEAEGNGQENNASLGQVIQKSDMQKNCALQEDESFQTQPHLSHRGFDTSQSPEKVSDGSARSNKELTSVEDQGQNDSIKMVETCQEESSALPLSKQKSSMSVENHSATEIEKSILSPEEGSPSPDVVETHVILPERSIQFPGLFANLIHAVKQTEDKSVGLKSVKQTTEDTSNSQELGVNTQSEPKIKNAIENMNLQSQSNSKPSGRSFHTNNRQVLKRVWQKGRCTESNNSSMCSEESELTVYKKMQFRRSSAPDLNNETEALLVKCPSPESNSCPSLPSDREYFCQDLQNDSKKSHLSSSMSEESEINLQVQSLREDKESFVKENMCSGDQTSIVSNEECPTIASLIAANLAADKEHSSSSSPRLDSKGESFLEPVANCDPKHGCQESESVQRPVSPSYNDSDRFIPSLPGTSKDKNVYSEKPMVVDKATGRLILKVRKHNQPRMKATKLPPIKDSTIERQENESDKSEDHFVRRSLRERKVVHRDENEVTEIDELMSEDDEEYHVEQDSDAYSSDSDVGRGEGSDHSQPKKMKKTRSAPDPTAFNVKLKGKYKCWLCRKVFLKCGFAKSHVLKKHTEKGLCAVDLGQSEYLGTPQLLLFCPKKCRYATLSMEGLKNHITTCEKEILCPVEVAEKFLETDYDELQKMGEKVLEIPEKKVRAPKKPQAKKSVPPEEKVENSAAERLEESANKNNSLMMNQAPTGQALENPEFQNFVSQKEQSFESTPLPVIPSANDEYEVVDVDLECIEQPGENKVAEQEQPRLPYSEPQQQTVPFHQQQHFHPPTPNVFQDSSVRPAQVHNSGFSSPQATRLRMNMPRQAFTGSVSNRGIRPPHPELVSNVASPVRGHVPVQPQSQMPSNLNPQSSSRPSFQPRPNLQQPVRFRQRVPQNSPNPSLPMQRTLQQTPRLPSGISSRGAHVASPYPQQTFARPPRQHLPQRQPGFPPQRFGPRQPAGAQIRPQVMNSPRGRGQVPRQQYPRQQLQHRGGGFSQTNHYPQQGAVPHGVSRNRNLDLAQDQDDAYTITETGVICLD